MNVYVFYRYMVGKLDRVGRRLDAILGHVMCSHFSENWTDDLLMMYFSSSRLETGSFSTLGDRPILMFLHLY